MIQWIQNEVLLKLLEQKSKTLKASANTGDETEAISHLPSVRNIPEVILQDSANESPVVVKVEAGVQANDLPEPIAKKDETNQTSDIIESLPDTTVRYDILPFAREISECILDEVISKESKKIGKTIHSEIFEGELLSKLNQDLERRDQFLQAIEAQRKEDQLEREKMIMEFNAERQKLLDEIRDAQKDVKERSILVSHEKEEALMILQQKLESHSPITSSPIKVVVKDQAVQSMVASISFEEPPTVQQPQNLPVEESKALNVKSEAPQNSLKYIVAEEEKAKKDDERIDEDIFTPPRRPLKVESNPITPNLQETNVKSSKNSAFIHIGKEPVLIDEAVKV
jgi:hypothetical protein